MLFHSLLLLPLLLSLLPLLCLSKCPKRCETPCSIPGYPCDTCLRKYYQTYSLQLKTCLCLPGFTLFPSNSQYCCPYECQSCGDFGCLTCESPNSSVDYSWIGGYINCTCQPNFYHNETTKKCICLAEVDNKGYYYNQITGECFKCPTGCKCSAQGCMSCNNLSNRVIKINQLNGYECPCIRNYKQINGVCSCPPLCYCSQSNLVTACSPQSHRINILNLWICQPPFEQHLSQCLCKTPNKLSSYDECICLPTLLDWSGTSKALDSYQFQGVCYNCLQMCTCSIKGCVSCPEGGKYLVENGACYCAGNYTRSEQDSCICGGAYYEVEEGKCRCMKELDSTRYYYDSVWRVCGRCPKGCRCQVEGCMECESGALRNVVLNVKGEYVCKCMDNAVENIKGVCVCLSPYKLINGECSCNVRNTTEENSLIISSPIYLNPDTKKCLFCPLGCTCSPSGCITCSFESMRTISPSSLSPSLTTCDCIPHSHPTSLLFCQCSPPYTLNSTSNLCQCDQPYYHNGNFCLCKSYLFPSKYYYNQQHGICKPCPEECICTKSGCISCTSDSLRNIITLKISICECILTSREVNNKCFDICDQGYYYNNDCIPCIGCVTCNKSGCLSCAQGLYLDGFECLCEDRVLINWNGTCQCSEGSYKVAGQCRVCPPNCQTCELFMLNISCTSCRKGMNRLETITSGCACVAGYKESFPMMYYCCKEQCFNCTFEGCTACYPNSFQVLKQNQCICQYPFVNRGKFQCQCDFGYYLLSDQCLSCPRNCKTCVFTSHHQSILCLSCPLDSNRNISHPTCKCLTNYTQIYPATFFCVAYYCISDTINCTLCSPPRIVSPENQCICPNGSYQTYKFTCQPCYIKGCLICLSFDLCTKCDINNGYYLTSTTCTKVNLMNYLYTYQADHSGVIVQFELNEQSQKIIHVEVNIFEVGTNQKQFESPTPLTIVENTDDSILTYSNVITLMFANSKITHSNVLMSFIIKYQPVNSDEIHSVQYSILHRTVYSDPLLSVFKYTPYCIGVMIYTFVMMIAGLVLHIFGYKHNQIVFSLQTMSYCVFAIFRPSLQHISVLYYMRVSYFGFGPGPFRNYFPDFYIQSAPRNYRFLTKDSNFLRVAGVPLVITVILGIVIFILRFCYSLYYKNTDKLNRKSKASIKLTYRIFQFLYKVMMYPMIFFSFQTFFYWDIYLYTDTVWKILARVVTVLIFSLYFTLVVLQLNYQIIPRSSKIQILNQYLSTIFTSIFILSNQTLNINNYLLMVMFPLITRDLVYIYNLYKYWDFVYYTYWLIFVPTVLQVLPIFMMLYVDNRSALFFSIVLLNLTQIGMPIYVMIEFNLHLKKDKVTVAIMEKGQDVTAKHLAEVEDHI